MTEERNTFNWSYFLIGILSIIAAVLAFRDPLANLVSLVVVYGAYAIIKGIFEIANKNFYFESNSTLVTIIGILNIIFGIILLFNIEIGVITAPLVFAIWFLIDSIAGIFRAKPIKVINKGLYWFTVILCIIGAVLGVMMINNPLSSLLTLTFLVGFYFMVSGIRYITIAF